MYDICHISTACSKLSFPSKTLSKTFAGLFSAYFFLPNSPGMRLKMSYLPFCSIGRFVGEFVRILLKTTFHASVTSLIVLKSVYISPLRTVFFIRDCNE